MKRDPESSVKLTALQDLLPHNHCFGCGPHNPDGLRIKSYWSGNELSVARFTPEPYHCAGPRHFVNGGILATIIDCHCICTAAGWAYRDAGREIGTGADFYYATSKLALEYRRPTPMHTELALEARVIGLTDRTYVLSCGLAARGKICVEATIEATRVPESWIRGQRETA
jgi:acyl-coenzyme A thioesterase PaaI-like protein